MLTLTVRVGEAVQIGDAACVGVADKSGRAVKLTIATNIRPVQIIHSGIFPKSFTVGITGERRVVDRMMPATAG